MDPVTALTIASLAINLGGNLFSRPKRRNFNANLIFPQIQRGVLQSTEAITAPIRQAAGENAAARGLTGGAGAQVVAQAEAPVRASAAAKLADIRGQLALQEEQSRYQDDMLQRQWLGQIFGDVAGGLGAFATGLVQKRYDDRLLDILSGDSGGAQTAQGAGGAMFGARKPALLPQASTQTGGMARQFNAGQKGFLGGFNATSRAAKPKRRRLANQYSNPLNVFGIGEYATEY